MSYPGHASVASQSFSFSHLLVCSWEIYFSASDKEMGEGGLWTLALADSKHMQALPPLLLTAVLLPLRRLHFVLRELCLLPHCPPYSVLLCPPGFWSKGDLSSVVGAGLSGLFLQRICGENPWVSFACLGHHTPMVGNWQFLAVPINRCLSLKYFIGCKMQE